MQRSISVIIPVYNGARFIRDALTSVCTQTYLPTEIVVADDVSTDNTREVVADFAKSAPVPITIIGMEKNTGGPYRPARKAFLHTTGKYVCILDADDMFVPDAFETYMSMFTADLGANVGLATSDYLTFADGTGATISPSSFARRPKLLARILEDSSPTGLLLERDEAIRVLASEIVLPFKGMLSREAWEALDGPDVSYVQACDCDFVWRLAVHGRYRIRVLNRPLVRIRMWPGSMSRDNVAVNLELIRLHRAMLRDVRGHELRSTIRRRLESELFDLAYASYKQRNYKALIPATCSLALARLRRLVSLA